MDLSSLRNEIKDFLGYHSPETNKVSFEIKNTSEQLEYTRYRIHYRSVEGDEIGAYLLIPKGTGPFPAAIVHHQNNSEWHLGKSEVCGIIGDTFQSFGHALANKGMVVLAPDCFCFEDRRLHSFGVKPSEEDGLRYLHEMSKRLIVGDFLMRKFLLDAGVGLSILAGHPQVDPQRIGTMGHALGGSIALFLSAVDERIKFAGISGAASTYKSKIINGTPFDYAEIIPGFVKRFDIPDLVKCIAPRKVIFLSTTEAKMARDVVFIKDSTREVFEGLGVPDHFQYVIFESGRDVAREQFKFITEWMAACGKE
ncbi:MAG: acetylxylan esterase [Firmicutes bacterium]|nr:acetylxylan esterase [Bacillota bacterium]